MRGPWGAGDIFIDRLPAGLRWERSLIGGNSGYKIRIRVALRRTKATAEAKAPGPAKFERDANCAPEASGTKGQLTRTRSRQAPSIGGFAAWDLGHRQECLCYWKATAREEI